MFSDEDEDIFSGDSFDSVGGDILIDAKPNDANSNAEPIPTAGTSDSRSSFDELTAETLRLKEESERLDELARQLKIAMSLRREMEKCYSNRADGEPIRCEFQSKYLSTGSQLILVKVENVSPFILKEWILTIFWNRCHVFSSSSESKSSSQSIEIGLLDIGQKKSFELFMSHEFVHSDTPVPVVCRVEMTRIFDLSGAHSCFRLPLNTALICTLHMLSTRAHAFIKPVRARSTISVPSSLVNLFSGCSDEVTESHVLRILLRPSALEHIVEPASPSVSVSLSLSRSTQHIVTFTVRSESRSFLVDVSTQDLSIRDLIIRDIKLYLLVLISGCQMSTSKRAFVLGASGAVGRQLVEALIASKQFSRVVLLGRRTLEDLPSSEVLEQKVVDFDNIDKHSDDFKDLDVGFCALGTTRAKSGAEGFYKIDHDYVVNSAKVAKEQGVKEWVMVTAAGSNPNSIFLYSKTKGEAERDVAALEFDKTLIVRPGFLEGRSADFRLGEAVAGVLVKPLSWISNKIAISCENVAKAMVVGALSTELKGRVVWDNAELLEQAKKYSF